MGKEMSRMEVRFISGMLLIFVVIFALNCCSQPEPPFDDIFEAERATRDKEWKHKEAWEYHEHETLIKALEEQPLIEWFSNHNGKVFITELDNISSAEQYISIFNDGVVVRNKNVLKIRESQKKRIRALYQKVKKHLRREVREL